MLEHVLDHAHAQLAGHGAARDRARAIRCDERCQRLRVRVAGNLVEHDQLVALEVERARGLQEAGLDAVPALRVIEQDPVQARARHGVDHFLRPLPVCRERERPIDRVQHAATHRDQEGFDVLEHACLAQCVNAAIGEGEVDGAACVHVHFAQVGTALVHDDLAALSRQVDGHQGAGETGPEDRHWAPHWLSPALCTASPAAAGGARWGRVTM